jgi:hypothetical protein
MKKAIYVVILLGVFAFYSCNKKEEPKKEEPPVEQVKDTVPKEEPVKKEAPVVKKEPVITFTVQIGAFKKFGQSLATLPNVNKYDKDEYSKYSLGSFKTVREAVNFMYSIEEDYPDAFVQALKDGEPIHISEALK